MLNSIRVIELNMVFGKHIPSQDRNRDEFILVSISVLIENPTTTIREDIFYRRLSTFLLLARYLGGIPSLLDRFFTYSYPLPSIILQEPYNVQLY